MTSNGWVTSPSLSGTGSRTILQSGKISGCVNARSDLRRRGDRRHDRLFPEPSRDRDNRHRTHRARLCRILAALAAKGGQKYLEKQADENPTAFLTLIGKIIPLQVTGKDGGPIQYQGINAPAKETREEWLARQAPAVADKTLH